MKNFLITISTCALLLFGSCNNESQKESNKTQVASTAQSMHEIMPGVKQVSNRQVCMVNNKFMNKDQIPVPINGKTYYGCCPGCVANLKQDTAYRFATDPETGERIDKSEAVIIVKPDTKDEVLYFKTEINAKKYIEKKNAK